MIGLLSAMILFFVALALFGTMSKVKEKEVLTCENQAFSVEVDDTVYVAHASKKYHKKGCHFISGDESPILKSEALREGYSSCKVCKP